MSTANALQFTPTRTAALESMAAFVPHMGRDYASRRNYDLRANGHAGVSRLSPYIRHRLLSEQEVLTAALSRFSLSSAEKFVQEVYWRTYWKGWLEMRPGVWSQYREGLRAARDKLATQSGMRADWEAACRGETGIDCFDAWANELSTTGYLHNHARMWFASIWIFTLRLPWELGADLFLRQLLDGDPASNTLGWRWVAGIQTPGKTYLARADNIARYTEGRFNPVGQLASTADPVDAPIVPQRGPAPAGETPDPARATGWLLTEEDMLASFTPLPSETPNAAPPAFVLDCTANRSPLAVAPLVTRFVKGALDDAISRHQNRFGSITYAEGKPVAEQVLDWAKREGITQIAMPFVPVGAASDEISTLKPKLDAANIRLVPLMRPYDAECWPHATHGFFKFKENIPKFVAGLKGVHPI
ncbi:DNA photolyase [Rhodobacteraceae bacterium SC52]|nr:DNA photolyase [Rhodobacteraceae bacterium SC52]